MNVIDNDYITISFEEILMKVKSFFNLNNISIIGEKADVKFELNIFIWYNNVEELSRK